MILLVMVQVFPVVDPRLSMLSHRLVSRHGCIAFSVFLVIKSDRELVNETARRASLPIERVSSVHQAPSSGVYLLQCTATIKCAEV